MLTQNLERALQLLLADLAERQGAERGAPVADFLQDVVKRALQSRSELGDTLAQLRGGRLEEATDDDEETGPAAAISDAESARIALQSLQDLQHTFLSTVLAYLSVSGNASLEIEGMFEVMGDAQRQLVQKWFSGESLRRTELLAQVMHDFRSPLTSVFFLADALYGGLSGPLPETQRQQIGLIFNAALSLLTLVDNVLSSRNLEAGDLELEPVPLSVATLGEEVERITRPIADQKGLALKFEVNCTPARVGDPDVLRRILLNLINNATNYTEEGSVSVRLDDKEDDLLIQVEDTGPGIDEKQLEDLFKTFRRGKDSERMGQRRFSGAGLGLSICHRLASLAGGDIWVESEVSSGSCFYVRLPFPPLEGSGG